MIQVLLPHRRQDISNNWLGRLCFLLCLDSFMRFMDLGSVCPPIFGHASFLPCFIVCRFSFYTSVLGPWLIVGQGSRMIASMDLNVGTVLTVVLAVMIGAFSLALLGPRIETFAKATAASQKIFQTLQRVPSIDSLGDNGEKPNGIKGNLELKGVSFVYPARPESIQPLVTYSFIRLIKSLPLNGCWKAFIFGLC